MPSADVPAAELRRRVRSFFDDDLPTVLAGATGLLERARAWRAAFYDAGLAGIGYPIGVGGHGGGPDELAVVRDESRGRVPPEESVFGIGIGMALPTVRDVAPPVLQHRFLRPGLRGEEVWCQLYSEPGAGSDLASLTTRAVQDGDEWIVTGQKVWTSGAQHSQLAVVLVRTDPDAPKHRGITMLVLPMDQPGVTVRPLRQLTGNAEFNEVFLDGARVPADWVVGEVNGGWRTAVALLAHERVATGTGSIARSEDVRAKAGRMPIPVRQLVELAHDRGATGDPLVRQQLARLFTGERLMAWLGDAGAHPSVGKLWRTLQGRGAADLAHRLALAGGAAWQEDDAERDYFAYHVLNCRGMSIGGGTDEMQRNTLAEKVLGLPRDPV